MHAATLAAAVIGVVLGAGLSALRHRRRLLALRRELDCERERLNREFVANVSHEFRTPLAAIKGFAESLRLGALDDQKTALEFVRTIEKHAERLSILVESLLDVSAVRADPQDVHLAPFIWGVVESFERTAARRKLAIRVRADALHWARVDPRHLAQALRCVLDNAVQFNRDGGRIDVEVRPAGGDVIVSVRDTGPGIAAEDLPRVFDRFAQRARSRPRLGGSGVGLSVARTVIEANKGRLRVDSSGPDGTVVELVVPAGRPSLQPSVT